MYHRISNKVRDLTLSDIRDRDTGTVKKKLTTQEWDDLREDHLFANRNTTIDLWAGTPNSLYSFLFHDKLYQMYERHCLYEMIAKMSQQFSLEITVSTFLEILTKGLVYREMEINTIVVVAPNLVYCVKKRIVTGKGFTAYLLKKVVAPDTDYDPSPEFIFVCCGSQFHPSGLDMLSCCIVDTEPCLGWEAYMSAKDILEALRDNFIRKKAKPRIWVSGHSLGGCLAQYVCSVWGNLVDRLVTYNGPGVPRQVHSWFRERIDSDHKIVIETHVTVMDTVPWYGGYHLGYNLRDELASTTVFWYEVDSMKVLHHTYFCQANPKNLPVTVKKFTKRSHLENLSNPPLENARWLFGFSTATLLRAWRAGFRFVVPSRTQDMTDRDLNKISHVFY